MTSTVVRPAAPRRLARSFAVQLIIIAILAAGFAVLGVELRGGSAVTSDHPGRAVPTNAAMEAHLGVRFSRMSVVADGGLVTLSYVVLDPEKAQAFQADVKHPPVLTSDSRSGSLAHVALMKQGHALRAGQTYYLIYDDGSQALRPGEYATIGYGRLRLQHVPVL